MASYIIMSGYDCRNKCVFSFRQSTVSDEADVGLMSSGRLFQSFGPAEATRYSMQDGSLFTPFQLSILPRISSSTRPDSS